MRNSPQHYCGNVDSRAAPTVFLSPGYCPTYPCSTPPHPHKSIFTHIVNLCGVGPVAQIIYPPPAPHNCTFPLKSALESTTSTQIQTFAHTPHKCLFHAAAQIEFQPQKIDLCGGLHASIAHSLRNTPREQKQHQLLKHIPHVCGYMLHDVITCQRKSRRRYRLRIRFPKRLRA